MDPLTGSERRRDVLHVVKADQREVLSRVRRLRAVVRVILGEARGLDCLADLAR